MSKTKTLAKRKRKTPAQKHTARSVGRRRAPEPAARAVDAGPQMMGLSQRAEAAVSMHRAMGNMRTLGVQARMSVGPANDGFEREAEDVSQRVMSGRAATRATEDVQAMDASQRQEDVAQTASAEAPAQALRQTGDKTRTLRQQEEAQAARRQAEETQALRRVGSEPPVQETAARQGEEQTAQTMRQAAAGDTAQALRRQADPAAQPARRQEEAQAARRQEEAQTLRRQSEETQALRRQSEEAQALRRQGEEAQAVRRQAEEAQALRRQAEEAQTLRRAGTEGSVQALRRTDEGAAMRVARLAREETPTRTLRRQGEEAAAEEGPWEEPAEGEVESLEAAGAQDDDMESAPEAGGVQASRLPEAGPEGGPISDPNVESRISAPSGGRPLPQGTRDEMESKFDANFSSVRVHDTPQDQSDARALGARAFTQGEHVWLGPKESTSDTKLMSHELTHVVQQGAAPQRMPARRQPAPRRVRRLGLDTILNKVAEWAKEIPGYHLLTVILGKDPISDQRVERNATNVVRGVMSLVPGGNKLFENLQKSGALERAFKWFSEQIAALNITWNGIKALFKRAWDEVSIWDGISGAWNKLKGIFGPTLSRILNFAKAVGKKVLEFIFEGALSLAGPIGVRVMGVIRKAGAAFSTIISDPIGFVKNLIGAVKKGFGQFSSNILKHLQEGIMGWLFGTLAKAGVTLPKKFDLKGILSLVLQILGITYGRIRGKLVKVVGEKRVAYIEKAVAFVKVLVTEGVAGVWKKLLEWIGNLKDMVIGAIRDWVVTKIVTAAVTKVISLFNPAGAIIQAIITVYNVISWLIQRMEQILALVESVVNSIAEIAAGKIGAAANYVEKTMARTLPVIISFLASLVGLGGIADKIKGIIKKIQAKVDGAIDKVIGFIVKKAKALFAKVKGAAKKGVEKIKSILWPKAKFTADDGENHEITMKEAGGKPQAMVASDRAQPIEELLTTIGKKLDENTSLSDKKKENAKKNLATARTAASALRAAAEQLATESTPANETAVFEAEMALAAALKPLFGQVGIEGKSSGGALKIAYDQVYKFEGLVGIYGKMGSIPSDKITPDHQPSSKVLKIVAATKDTDGVPLFKDAAVQDVSKGHSEGGVTINLAAVRHYKTRTYGGGGSAVGKQFESDAQNAIKSHDGGDEDLATKKEKKRDAVLGIAKQNMKADADTVRSTVLGNLKMESGQPWSDIGKLQGSQEEKDELQKKIKGQIEGGETQIERQDFAKLKQGAKDE